MFRRDGTGGLWGQRDYKDAPLLEALAMVWDMASRAIFSVYTETDPTRHDAALSELAKINMCACDLILCVFGRRAPSEARTRPRPSRCSSVCSTRLAG